MTDEARRRAVQQIMEYGTKRGAKWQPLSADVVDEYVADAVAQAVKDANKEWYTPTCQDSLKKAVKGVCPEHGGDSCLVASFVVQAVAQAVRAERERVYRSLGYHAPGECDLLGHGMAYWVGDRCKYELEALRREPTPEEQSERA